MSGQYIGANILEVPYLKEMLLALRYEAPLDKISFYKSGVLTYDAIMARQASMSTGTLEIPYWEFEKTKAQDWTGTTDTIVHNIPNRTQRAVIMGILNAWGANHLANHISNGMTPDEAIAQVIDDDLPIAVNERILASINGALKSLSASKLLYTVNGAITGADYKKAIYEIFQDRTEEAVVALIMHSDIKATLELEITNKQQVNFLDGIEIITDNEGTDNKDGTYNTYMFKKNTIKWTNFLPIGNDSRFVEINELKNHGQKAAGYRERFALAINGFDFKGTLANPVGATTVELETGTNWELKADQRRTGIGIIKAKSYKSVVATAKASKGGIEG